MSEKILSIESSCDETGAAVSIGGKIVSNVIAAQEIHEKYGGVVPELASRAHLRNIVPVVHKALSESGIKKNQLNAIAFTQGPGLLGALMIGVNFAKSLALALNIPLIAVHHMKAHVLASFIDHPKINFPFLALVVSGGHTLLLQVNDIKQWIVLGQTKDDAVGEAFDKIGKILGFKYPAGPIIDQYAQEGNPLIFEFPITNMPALDYSFSGIKTSFLYLIKRRLKENSNFIEENKADLCASIQYTLIKMLILKLKKAVRQTSLKNIVVAGGVAANQGLREELKKCAKKEDWNIYIPKPEYCTDNAAMIAMAAHFQYLIKDFCDFNVQPNPRIPLEKK